MNALQPYKKFLRSSWIFFGLALVLYLSGCSSVNIDAAKTLGAAGQQVSAQSAEGIFVTDDKYLRAMDAEAFFRGFTKTEMPEQLAENYEIIHSELSARRLVFTRLNEVYSAFTELASIDAATGFETSINGLGDAVNGYAAARGSGPVISSSVQGVIATIGGMTAAEIQRKKIVESSVLVRERLTAFVDLFSDPLVKTQFTTFKENLAANRTAAIRLLWKKGAFDPSPLLDQIGAEAGLKATKESVKMINNPDDSSVRDGLEGVIKSRFNRKMDAIERSYDASVAAVNELIDKHEQLEAGDPLDLGRLRQIIGELQRITQHLVQ